MPYQIILLHHILLSHVLEFLLLKWPMSLFCVHVTNFIFYHIIPNKRTYSNKCASLFWFVSELIHSSRKWYLYAVLVVIKNSLLLSLCCLCTKINMHLAVTLRVSCYMLIRYVHWCFSFSNFELSWLNHKCNS